MQLNKNTLIIFYKLLHDTLFMALIFFTLTLIAEAALPGIIISHIGFSKIVIIILLNVLLLKIVAKKIPLDQFSGDVNSENKSVEKFIFPLIALGALLFFNNQMGINVFLNLFLLILIALIGYLSYQILFVKE
jgi:uncharacterized membrane protein